MENDLVLFDFLSSFSNEDTFTNRELEPTIGEKTKEKSRVRYGKSYLNKNSQDYKKWRERNNQSIQICRKKKKDIEIERRNKLIELKNENNKMIEMQLEIIKELACFKILLLKKNNKPVEQVNLENIDKFYKELLIMKKESSSN
jgi:hypothetical protein